MKSFLTLLLGLTCLCPCLRAEEKVPSKPASAAAEGVQPDRIAQPLEFRGLLIDEDGEFFRITERTSGKSFWVGLNETGAPFVVRRYDGRRQVVTVEYEGRTIVMPLRKSKVVPADRRAKADQSKDSPADLAAPTGGAARREAVRAEIKQRDAGSTSVPSGAPIARDDRK